MEALNLSFSLLPRTLRLVGLSTYVLSFGPSVARLFHALPNRTLANAHLFLSRFLELLGTVKECMLPLFNGDFFLLESTFALFHAVLLLLKLTSALCQPL